MARDYFPNGNEPTLLVSVRDESGRKVLRVTLSSAAETLPANPSAPFR